MLLEANKFRASSISPVVPTTVDNHCSLSRLKGKEGKGIYSFSNGRRANKIKSIYHSYEDVPFPSSTIFPTPISTLKDSSTTASVNKISDKIDTEDLVAMSKNHYMDQKTYVKDKTNQKERFQSNEASTVSSITSVDFNLNKSQEASLVEIIERTAPTRPRASPSCARESRALPSPR